MVPTGLGDRVPAKRTRAGRTSLRQVKDWQRVSVAARSSDAWGQKTWDEMMIGWYVEAVPNARYEPPEIQ